MNWPIADEIRKLLLKFNEDLIPHVKCVLRTNNGVWKYWILDCLIRDLPSNVIIELKPDIERIRNNPTQDEINEELHEIIEEILQGLS